MTFSIKQTGSWDDTAKWMAKNANQDPMSILKKYGEEGVSRLSVSTPVESGKTASSWEYAIDETKEGYTIRWYNTNKPDGVPVVILLQYGHGTKDGGYVQGRDFINGPTRAVFDRMASELWKEVKR